MDDREEALLAQLAHTETRAQEAEKRSKQLETNDGKKEATAALKRRLSGSAPTDRRSSAGKGAGGEQQALALMIEEHAELEGRVADSELELTQCHALLEEKTEGE